MKKLKNILNEVLSERLVRGLKPLLMIGSTIKSNVGEKALVDLSDKFDQIDDEQADDIASHLNMAIELMQDRSPSEARGWLKKFNKACADALSGRSIKSAFEGVDENTTDGPRYKKYVAKAFEDILGAQFDFRHAMGVKQLTNKDMKLKKKADAIYKAIIDLQKDMRSRGLTEAKLNEYEGMDINDPILIAVRARQTALKKKAALPKVKKISTKQYYKLMDKESDIIDQMKDAAKEYQRLDSEMNQDAGQKGSNWTDADANRYGGDLNKLQTRIEKLAKEKLKVKKAIMNYRIG